MNKMNNI